jgi:hypothetical protein
MKQNITLSIDKQLLRRARAVAAQRHLSVSSLLAEELQKLVASETAYQKAQASALALLKSPLPLGGKGIADRQALHERKDLR